MRSVPGVIMRGGTSKAVFLREADLPGEGMERDRMVSAIFGSPDKRQIDGLGGADPLTSKLAIIGPPRPDDERADGAQLSYTFGQVGIEVQEVDYLSLCGNITSAVGLYAIQENMIAPEEPVTMVRIFNTNLNRILNVEVPVAGRLPIEKGDYAIPGVPGTGARILVDLAETAGAATGALLPTGSAVDTLDIPEFGPLEVSLVDIGNAHVFIRAKDLGLDGIESPAELDGRPDLLDLLETIRGHAAHRMNMIDDPAQSVEVSPATPILSLVSSPADYRDHLTGHEIQADDLDLVSRLMFMQQTHQTYAGTSTVCTGAASRIPGTLVHEVAREIRDDQPECRIGHPAGVIVTEVNVQIAGNQLEVTRATLGRTARRLMQGTIMLPETLG